MRCALPEQRRYFRIHLPIQAVAIFRDWGIGPQSALLRDINMLGAFFYCKQRPSLGHNTRLEFALPEQGEQITATCEGRVVRVEDSGLEGAIGVAIELVRYELERPPKQEHAGQLLQRTPFIGWTVEMVERMFEKSSELPGPEEAGDKETGDTRNVTCRAPQ